MIFLVALCALGATVGIVLLAADRPSGGREPGAERLSGAAALLALVWVVGAILSLFFVPMLASETHRTTAGSDVVTVTREAHPLVQVHAGAEAVAVAVGLVVLAIGWRFGRPPRPVLLTLAVVTTVLVVLAAASIGFIFLPVPVLLFVAAAAGGTDPADGRSRVAGEQS